MKIQGQIRFKIILVVIPILALTSLFIGLTSYYSARNGITGIAKEFLGYKLNDLYNYTARQYSVIKDMNLTNDPTLMENAKNSVIDYSKTIINSQTGGFLAVGNTGAVDFTSLSNFTDSDAAEVLRHIDRKTSGWLEFQIGFRDYVGVFINFYDWQDYFVILDDSRTFYSNVNEILSYLIIILGASIVISSVLLLFFIAKITTPIKSFVGTIQDITAKMDLTRRVRIIYPDEIGYLAYYFNNMISELESAYNQIKNYAYQTVLAKKKEERIRFIFQKYVPSEVINQILNISADSMLIGNRQKVSVLFSDIRSFTSISESMSPEDLVLNLNAYFNKMGIAIAAWHGIIDKFIGDAIMAIFGAPITRENDAENSINAALQMQKLLKEFNADQEKIGKKGFQTGIGINTGDAIVGNIGSEQKVDYTVIGDTVNLASRLESLTKKYHVHIIISESTKASIAEGRFFYREVDNVRVVGKNEPVKIYEPYLMEDVKDHMDYFEDFHQALNLYYQGEFLGARSIFEHLCGLRKEDEICNLYIERCKDLIKNPPKEWDGVETWTEK